MVEETDRGEEKMYGKIQISGKIELVTGLHIGGSAEFAAIGAVDSPVIRDRRTDLPIIPGSSLKGKLRLLIAKLYSDKVMLGNHDDDPEIVIRLFGTAKKGSVKSSRLLFSDMILSNMEELKQEEIHSPTEIKFENTISRTTAVANPRQIERVIRGSKFDLDIVYNMENEEDVLDDFKAIKEGLSLLQYDYLGGNGSRGYGKIQVSDLKAEAVVGDINKELIDEVNTILKEV